MTTDEAIRRLELRVKGEFIDYDPGDVSDLKLGIEALKAWKDFRTDRRIPGWMLLLGETEE